MSNPDAARSYPPTLKEAHQQHADDLAEVSEERRRTALASFIALLMSVHTATDQEVFLIGWKVVNTFPPERALSYIEILVEALGMRRGRLELRCTLLRLVQVHRLPEAEQEKITFMIAELQSSAKPFLEVMAIIHHREAMATTPPTRIPRPQRSSCICAAVGVR